MVAGLDVAVMCASRARLSIICLRIRRSATVCMHALQRRLQRVRHGRRSRARWSVLPPRVRASRPTELVRVGRGAGGRAGLASGSGGDLRGWVVQMSFGGHHALNASDQVQKKLQETMATDQELQDGLAGINITDNDNRSDVSMELLPRHV
jgi:hypothetical protein